MLPFIRNIHTQWEYIAGFFLVGLYAATTRFLAVPQIYHQDEHRWALASNPVYDLLSTIPHPFLSRMVYSFAGGIVGYDHLRVVPIVISVFTLGLLLFYMRKWYGLQAALATGFVYVLVSYVLIGSTQIDIDGSFLPLLALISFVGYKEYSQQTTKVGRYISLCTLGIGICLGLLTKLSAVLVPVAIVMDYAFHNEDVRRWLLSFRVMLMLGLAGVVSIVIFFVFREVRFISYVSNFIAFGGRDYMQVLFQSAKVLFYASLFIPIGVVLGLRYMRALSMWYIFLLLNFLFYFVIFDFTHRTFDRYLMFIIVPGVVITGYSFIHLFQAFAQELKKYFLSTLSVATVVIAYTTHSIFSKEHTLVALIPKDEFVSAVRTFSWDILFPLSGGSGPLGFYLPLDGMLYIVLLSFISGIIVVWVSYSNIKKPIVAGVALGVFLASVIVQNGFVTYEYLTGGYYGNATLVTKVLIDKIPEGATSVRSYNDIGAYELYEKGIYAGRFYPHEAFFEANEKRIHEYTGMYLVVDMPHLNPDQLFGKFFSLCSVVATSSDKYIEGRILLCDDEAKNAFKLL